MNIKTKKWAQIGLVALLIPVGACDKILEVERPAASRTKTSTISTRFPRSSWGCRTIWPRR